jgi:hypothetical protein
MIFGGENSGLPTYPLTPVYRCHKLVDSFSPNHFFGGLGTDFSDCGKGSELPFFLNKRKDLCLQMHMAFFEIRFPCRDKWIKLMSKSDKFRVTAGKSEQNRILKNRYIHL